MSLFVCLVVVQVQGVCVLEVCVASIVSWMDLDTHLHRPFFWTSLCSPFFFFYKIGTFTSILVSFFLLVFLVLLLLLFPPQPSSSSSSSIDFFCDIATSPSLTTQELSLVNNDHPIHTHLYHTLYYLLIYLHSFRKRTNLDYLFLFLLQPLTHIYTTLNPYKLFIIRGLL